MANLQLVPWRDERPLSELEDKGRPARTLAGSHIADLVHLRKGIMLCSTCLPKWNPKSVGYITAPTVPMCGGRCDGCKENGMDRRMFLHHQHMPR